MWDAAWEDPPEDTASAEIKASHTKRVDLLSWCVECWLPKCVDEKWYNAAVRPRQRLTSKVDALGKQKAMVTVTREAYGFIQFENSRSCWIAKFQWDDEQAEKKRKGEIKKCVSAPNYSKAKHAATKDYKCKWSDYAQGSQSKWDPVVHTEHELKMNKVEEWRKKDEEMNYKGQDFAMKLSQDRQGLSQEDLLPKPNRKKRSRGKDSEDADCVPPAQPKHRGFRDD